MSIIRKMLVAMILMAAIIIISTLVGLALEPVFGWGIAPILIISGTLLALGLSFRYLPGLLFSGFTSTLFGVSKDSQRILSTGKQARATVLQIGENSGGGTITINDQPYLNLRLMVEDGERPPYEVSLNTVIPRAAIPQFQPGAVLPIRIDPQDPMNIVLDQSG